MSTKAEIQALIESKLASGSGIIAIDHRDVLKDDVDNVLDNLYGLKTTDTNATTNVLTEFSPDRVYDLKIDKQGGEVNLRGRLKNNTGVVLPFYSSFAEITNNEYFQDNYIYSFYGKSTSSGDDLLCFLSNNFLIISSPIGIGETVSIDFKYNTLN